MCRSGSFSNYWNYNIKYGAKVWRDWETGWTMKQINPKKLKFGAASFLKHLVLIDFISIIQVHTRANFHTHWLTCYKKGTVIWSKCLLNLEPPCKDFDSFATEGKKRPSRTMNQFFTTLPKSNVLRRVFRELLSQHPSLPLFLQRARINHSLKVLCLGACYTWADSYTDFKANHTPLHTSQKDCRWRNIR